MKFSTNFPLTEDPISESGAWVASTDADLTRFRTVPGKAIAKATGVNFDDSAALQTRVYGADTEIQATVFLDPTLNTGATHECELLFRSSVAATFTIEYEHLFSFQGSTQCVRWFNNSGSQGFAFLTAIAGSISILRQFQTGDRIRGRVVGDCLEMSVIGFDGTKFNLGFYKDSNISAAGAIGIGGYTGIAQGGNASKFCFTSVQFSDEFVQEVLFDTNFTGANQSPLSQGGTWLSCAGAGTLRLVSNQVAATTADTDSLMRYTGFSADFDHWSEVTVGVVGGRDFGIALGVQPNGDCILTTNGSGENLEVYTRIGGVFSQRGQVATVLQATDRVRGRRFGGDVIIAVNEVDVLTAEIIDPQVLGGQPGIFMFDATARISRFRAGNVSAVFPSPPSMRPGITGSIIGSIKGRIHS